MQTETACQGELTMDTGSGSLGGNPALSGWPTIAQVLEKGVPEDAMPGMCDKQVPLPEDCKSIPGQWGGELDICNLYYNLKMCPLTFGHRAAKLSGDESAIDVQRGNAADLDRFSYQHTKGYGHHHPSFAGIFTCTDLSVHLDLSFPFCLCLCL